MKKNVFLTITFPRLWKNEFRDLVNKVVEFLIQHNPVTMDLQFVYDKLVKAQAALRLLHVPYGSHPKTVELSDNREKRNKLIRALVAQIKVLKRANAIYTIPQLEIIAPFVERYLNPIVKSNSSKQTDILKEMYLELEGDTSLNDTITNLNLRSYFDELKGLQLDFTQTVMQRSNSKSVRPKIITSDIRENAELALRNLMNEIELVQMKHPEVDYNPLINNLNETFAFYMSQVKSRSSNKKQIAAKSKVRTINMTTTAQNGNSDAVAI